MASRACIGFPNYAEVEVCLSEMTNGILSSINFIISGHNDDTCDDCQGFHDVNGLKNADNQEIYQILEKYLHQGEKFSLTDYIDIKNILKTTCKTPFQEDVISSLLNTDYGDLVSYETLAAQSGHPGAARAVGNVMRRNRFSIIIPCHRVVAKRGIGGFGGNNHPIFTGIKKKLQEIEKRIKEKYEI